MMVQARRLMQVSLKYLPHGGRRHRHITYPLLALGALTLASVVIGVAHHRLEMAIAGRVQAQQAFEAAQQRLADLNRQAAYARAVEALMQKARDAGYGPGQWGTRRIDIKQATMSRETFNTVLSQIARSPSQMFGADEFELSMKNASGSLFEMPFASGGDAPLSVTLSGTLYFRLGAS